MFSIIFSIQLNIVLNNINPTYFYCQDSIYRESSIIVGFYELSHKIKYNLRDKLFLVYNMY